MKSLTILFIAAAISSAASQYSDDHFKNEYAKLILNKFGNHYQNQNVGIGKNNKWSGQRNQWIGNQNQISGADELVVGNQNKVSGYSNSVNGNQNYVSGANSEVRGQNNKVKGIGNTVIGTGNIVSGSDSSDIQLNIDDLLPDWMKDPKSQKDNSLSVSNKDKFNTKQVSPNTRPTSYTSSGNNYIKSPVRSSQVYGYSYMRPSYEQYGSRFNVGYPYSTSYYYPQTNSYSPWNGWQQWYTPRTTQAAYYNPWGVQSRSYYW